MAEQSPRMEWTYPAREDDPWYDAFKDFVIAVDGSGFANREDRSIIWSGGGTLSWDLASKTFTWTDTINAYSPMSAKLIQIAAGSITDWGDGQVIYVDLVRLALTNTARTLVKANTVDSSDDAMAVAVRIGSRIYFRTGMSMGDADSVVGIAPSPSSGDPTAIHVNVPSEINGIAAKAVPTISDIIVIEDVADSLNKKKVLLGNLPGVSTDRYGPSIIVGSGPAGDTLDQCHYLDTGNGSGLEAAILAAAGTNPSVNPPKNVLIRPGTYDFRVGGGPSGRINIPNNVQVRGAGRQNVVVVGHDQGDMGIFRLNDGSLLERVSCQVPLPVAPGTTSRGVVMSEGLRSEIRLTTIEFDGPYTPIEAAFLYLQAAFYFGSSHNLAKLIDCEADGPVLGALGPYEFYGARFLPDPSSIDTDVIRLRIFGCDVGFWTSTQIRVVESEFYGFRTLGGYIYQGAASGSDISNNVFQILGVPNPGAGSYGLLIDDADRVNVMGNHFGGDSGAHSSVVAIALSGALENVISGNRGRFWPTAVNADATSNGNTVMGNNFGGNPYVNNGTGNDFAHNL